MEETLKFVTSLPLPAVMAFAAMLGLVFGIAKLGIIGGQKTSPAHDAPTAQVAAVIVDPTALNNAAAALNRHTNAVEQLIEVGESIARSVEHVAIELDRIRDELRIQSALDRRN